jgi:hypothetical protein
MQNNVAGTHETIVLEPKVRELARTISPHVLPVTRVLLEVREKGLELKGELV